MSARTIATTSSCKGRQGSLEGFLQKGKATTEPDNAADVSRFRIEELSATSYIIQGVIPPSADIDFDQMMAIRPDAPDIVIMMGKPTLTPRYVAHYLRPYSYAGRMHPASPLPAVLTPLLEWCNGTVLAFWKDEQLRRDILIPVTATFNQLLVNYYLDGSHYIGKHSDDERQLIPNTPVFSASFGQERVFRVRSKVDGGIVKDSLMKNGSFLMMCGDMQKEFTHEVPKVMGRKGALLNPRINVTCRMFN